MSNLAQIRTVRLVQKPVRKKALLTKKPESIVWAQMT